MKPQLSIEKERTLLDDFLANSPEQSCPNLLRFCQQYRDLNLGASFLNEAHSTLWLSDWRESGSEEARITLEAVQRWTSWLFERQAIDDDAFYYLDAGSFVAGLETPIRLEWNLQSSIRAYAKARTLPDRYRPISVRIYMGALHDFNLFQGLWPHREPGWEQLGSETLLLAWLQTQRVDARNVGSRLGRLRDFLEFLRATGRVDSNSADLLRARYPRKGWHGLAKAVGSSDLQAALQELSPAVRFSSFWGPRMMDFIQLKRSLGVGFDFEERTLAQLDRYLITKESKGAGISPPLVHHWLENLPGINSRTCDTKRRVAEHFFDYTIRLGDLAENPAHFRCEARWHRLPPFVFSGEHVRTILCRAAQLQDIPFFPNRGATYEAIFATLYCLGLRVSEACRLSKGDVDLEQGLVLISKSKFYKSRLLPVGPKYRDYLARFLNLRGCGASSDPRAPLFASCHGRRINRKTIGVTFRGIARDMGLEPEPGQRGPCLHSFRHSFARHRLLRWYREGADVQAKLPLLSTYLGHLDIASTQTYLDATPELLMAANDRFEARFGREPAKVAFQ